jgi:hypothetical protein
VQQTPSAAVLLQLPSAADMSAADVERLLLRCIQLRWPSQSSWYDPAANAEAMFSSLKAPQRLGTAALLRLLQAAVAHRDALLLPLLVRQPAAAGIAAADVAMLLEKAVLRSDKQLVKHLCQLPEAQAIGPDNMRSLLSVAVSCRVNASESPCDAGCILVQLPGARQLSDHTLQVILQMAASSHHDSVRCPAAP